ncbi:MAG: methylmalonate-semialdehyde dehydrogenase (acylating) [Gammaproteobacteria bacterium RIFCSPHIGHO2_12_FULL_40_19]|nr:MAG: methylmalonate-semialdehyde dehydrogenase (acylating) [Gammaproteobacteria bacterium RIFCSPHIGHO2_12_FULL_40_19]
MTQSVLHYINHQLVKPAGNKHLPIYNPATGGMIKQVTCATTSEINDAILAAKTAFTSWAQVSPLKRTRVLFNFKALLDKNIDQLSALLTQEHGKTFDDAKGEVLRAIELVEFSCGTPYLLQGNYSENVGTEVDTYTIKQSLGVCVGISPFNFPVMISTWMGIPAIACGNTFILKPSEKDPSATLLLAQLLQEAGLPSGVFNVLQGDKETVDALITHPDVAAVSAVGSTAAAKHIYQTAMHHGKRAHTFGGAKNHCVVMPDADINETADAILGAAFGAAGERCMAISVVIAVTDSVADHLISRLKIKIPQLIIASGMHEKTDMGPLITQAHLERVKKYVDVGIKEGATLIVDGREIKNSDNDNGFFMGGCLFDQVTKNMRIYREEIFGPVLCIVRVNTFEEAIALINENQYGNGVSLFTQNGGIAKTFASKINVGMIGINVPIPVPVAYHTFGGWKQSVFGDIAMHGAENVHFYTRSKTVTVRWPINKKELGTFDMQSH